MLIKEESKEKNIQIYKISDNDRISTPYDHFCDIRVYRILDIYFGKILVHIGFMQEL